MKKIAVVLVAMVAMATTASAELVIDNAIHLGDDIKVYDRDDNRFDIVVLVNNHWRLLEPGTFVRFKDEQVVENQWTVYEVMSDAVVPIKDPPSYMARSARNRTVNAAGDRWVPDWRSVLVINGVQEEVFFQYYDLFSTGDGLMSMILRRPLEEIFPLPPDGPVTVPTNTPVSGHVTATPTPTVTPTPPSSGDFTEVDRGENMVLVKTSDGDMFLEIEMAAEFVEGISTLMPDASAGIHPWLLSSAYQYAVRGEVVGTTWRFKVPNSGTQKYLPVVAGSAAGVGKLFSVADIRWLILERMPAADQAFWELSGDDDKFIVVRPGVPQLGP